MKTILEIKKYVDELTKIKKQEFQRIFDITEDIGTLKVPKEMTNWVEQNFGSVKRVEKQRIIRVDNKITFESALFNELRTSIPVDTKISGDLNQAIKEKIGDPFDHPLTGTPFDSFGRIKGKDSITASNIAKYDALHELIVFDDHNPLKIQLSEIKNHFQTADKWIKKANKEYPKNKYPFIMWNCLWKSGASIIHGHMQVLLAKNRHYGSIEKLRKFSLDYEKETGQNYFEEFINAHKAIGLGFESKKTAILAHLTPKKEKEVIIIGDNLKTVSEHIYKVLKAYKTMGVESFNVGVYLEPVDKSWKLPIIARIVDRGALFKKTVDIGAMELFAGTNIIGSDPYKIISEIKKKF